MRGIRTRVAQTKGMHIFIWKALAPKLPNLFPVYYIDIQHRFILYELYIYIYTYSDITQCPTSIHWKNGTPCMYQISSIPFHLNYLSLSHAPSFQRRQHPKTSTNLHIVLSLRFTHPNLVMSYTSPSPHKEHLFEHWIFYFTGLLGHPMPEVQYLPANLWLLELVQRLHHQGVLKPSRGLRWKLDKKRVATWRLLWWVMMNMMMELFLLYST